MNRFVLTCLVLLTLSHTAMGARILPRTDWICEGEGARCFYIEIKGEIVKGDTERFSKMIELGQHGSNTDELPRTVVLNSPGGDVHEAMRLGREIRKRMLETGVTKTDQCLSACILVFSGGVRRIAMGKMGVHSFYSPGFTGSGDFEKASEQYNELAEAVEIYLRDMRIPRSLLDLIIRVPASKMHILSIAELEQYALYGTDPVFRNVDQSKDEN